MTTTGEGGRGASGGLAIAGGVLAHKAMMTDAGPALDVQGVDDPRRESGVRAVAAVTEDTAIRALLSAHFDFIWRSLRRLGLSSADADDATQQVFWVAARKLDRIEAGRERAFLFGTAVRVAADARRAAARRIDTGRTDVDVLDPLPGPEELTEQRRARHTLDEILDSMPLEMRTAFVLFELEELNVTEIASLCGIPVGTVASRLRRARELFQAAAKRYRAKGLLRGGRI